MDGAQLGIILAGLPVREVVYYNSISSTNDEALEWASEGAGEGLLLVADEQTAGRGRFDRRWVTRPGAALAFSLLLKPTADELSSAALFSPLAGLTLSLALEKNYGLQPQIKWPNDVLLNGLKCAGILVEAVWHGSDLKGVVIGVGINVTQEAVPPAEELLFPATSVEQAAGRPVDRWELLRAVLAELFEWRSRLLTPAFSQAWESRLAYVGQWIEVSRPNAGPVIGKLLGVTDGGDLKLEALHGDIETVTAGDVRLRPINNDKTHPGG
jgi:BirA family biotin operon repressor/biotin-[acetyl-CoA-carboxylase] ligase